MPRKSTKSVEPKPEPGVFMGKGKRRGKVTETTKELLAKFLVDQPKETTPAQITALAKLTGYTPETLKKTLADVRANLVARSQRYADIHMTAVENALLVFDNETALKGAQWALTNISAEGERIVDKQATSVATPSQGPRVAIAVQLGGVDHTRFANVQATAVEGNVE